MYRIKSKNKAIHILAILLLLAAILYQNFADKQNVLGLLQLGEPETVRFESLDGDYTSYKLWDSKEKFLGYGVITDASGYGGKLAMLSIIDEAGVIKAVSLIEDYETPLYLNKVLLAGLIDKISGRNIQAGLTDIDAVSGATVTTKAILTAIEKGAAQIGNKQLGMHISLKNQINIVWQDIVAVILVLLSAFCAFFNIKKARAWLLALAVLFIGFIMNNSLTYSNFVNILFGNFPVFIERPIWYIMVPGILIVTLIWGRNFYCSWLCSFGAVQEGVFKSLNLYNFSPSQGIRNKVAKIRWPMLWIAAMMALVTNNAGITGYEPFSVFFDGSGNTAQWIIMIFVLVICMAQMRFWCNYFCPVGVILNFTALLRGKLKKYPIKPDIMETLVCDQCANTSCTGRKEPLNKQDKVFILLSAIINVLILMALLQNIM